MVKTQFLQSELQMKGFITKLTPLDMLGAPTWGVDALVGARPKAQDIPDLFDIKNEQRWDLIKPFNSSRHDFEGIGGITSEPIGKALVDKGNWPVITSFGLHYAPFVYPKKGEKEKWTPTAENEAAG